MYSGLALLRHQQQSQQQQQQQQQQVGELQQSCVITDGSLKMFASAHSLPSPPPPPPEIRPAICEHVLTELFMCLPNFPVPVRVVAKRIVKLSGPFDPPYAFQHAHL